VSAKNQGRKVYAWDESTNYSGNMEQAARAFVSHLLTKAGYPLDVPASLDGIYSIKSGQPIGYIWE
jgi:hypothetical protein